MSSVSTTVIPEDSGPSYQFINASGLPDELIHSKVMKEVASWAGSWKSKKLSIFDRAAYIAPDSPYSQFKLARAAVNNDDVVSGTCEVTAGLTFQGMKWEADDADDSDVYNQIAAELNLDEFARFWYKEDFTFSQAVVGMWWGRKTFTVRGTTITPEPPEQSTDELGQKTFTPKIDPATGKPVKPKKTKRRKKYDIVAPLGLTFLDPMKVIPLSPTVFGRDRLAWQSNPGEINYYQKIQNGEVFDPIMSTFFMGQLELSPFEQTELQQMGVDTTWLLELNPNYVFRICPNRIPYERFADLRLKSVFPLLDLKQQLLEADRVALVGQANYILLVRKGSKDEPATPEEIKGAREGVWNLAKVPVVVGDHRLTIDIITPDQQWALDKDRYDTIDARILNRCLGVVDKETLSPETLSRIVARTLENKRHMLKRVLEEKIGKAVMDHPFNEGKFKEAPNVAYTPRNVQIDADSQMLQAILSLRMQGDLSRESGLEAFGYDQDVEAQRKENEEENGYNDLFKTQIPFSAPGQTPQQAGIAGGGRPVGGGNTANSPQKKAQPRTATGNKAKEK